MMNSKGKNVGTIRQLQDKGENIDEAPQGSEVAVSMNEPIIDRHIHEGDDLFTVPKSDEVKFLQGKFSVRLTTNEVETLNRIVEIKR